MTKIEEIQTIIGVTVDGLWGPKSQAAFDAIIKPGGQTVRRGKASSFADPKDVERYRNCRKRGGSDNDCKRIGDNGEGCWGDATTEGSGPSCAVSPNDMIERWGSVAAAKHKLIEVSANDKTVTCVLKDRMPEESHKLNPAVIDLNPDACRELGVEPPIMISASWRWV